MVFLVEKRKRLMKRIACLVAAIITLAGMAGAQESRATIQGNVKDSMGGVRRVWRWQDGASRRVWNVLQPAGWQSGVHQFRTVADSVPGIGQQRHPRLHRRAKHGSPAQSG